MPSPSDFEYASLVPSQASGHTSKSSLILYTLFILCARTSAGSLLGLYNESEDWLDELNQYLWGNYTVLRDFIEKYIPQWKLCRLEGTYLPWVDISAMGITSQELCDRLLSEAKVWINPGTMYGPETGRGYIRLNIAIQRSRLEEALIRIKKVLA